MIKYLECLNYLTLRECIEKIQCLKTPEERHRRMLEIPEVHTDPKMNPNYESEEDAGGSDVKKQGLWDMLIFLQMIAFLFHLSSYRVVLSP